MKKQVLYIALLFTINIFAQTPQSFNYQSVIRDVNTNILSDQNVALQFIIHQNSATGLAVYTETWTTTTNVNGIVNTRIGQGATTDNFTAIDWASGPYFLETLVDFTETNQYVSTGVSQLISTPYALHAENVTNDAVNDADADPTNEIQNLSNSSSGTDRTLNITGGNGTTFSIADTDNDSSNELQNLTLTNNGDIRNIFITNGASTQFNVIDNDNNPNNEIQNLSNSVNGTNRTINITGGTGTTFSIADTDNDSTNELQSMSLNGTVLSLNNGGNSVNLNSLDLISTSDYDNSVIEFFIDASNGTGWESVTTAGELIQEPGKYLVLVSFRCKIQGGSGNDLLDFRIAAISNSNPDVSSNGTGLIENIKDHRGEYGYIDFHRQVTITQSGQYTLRLQMSKANTDDDIYFDNLSISSIKIQD